MESLVENMVRIGVALCVLTLVGAYFFFAPVFDVTLLTSSAHHLNTFVQKNYALSVFLYLCAYVVSSIFLLPLSVVLTLLGGFLFGALYGTLYALLGATIGATLCFLMVRYVLRDFVTRHYAHQIAFIQDELQARGIYYLLSVRFFALIPFAFINVVAGVLPVSLPLFACTTLIGMLPEVSVYAYVGQSLATLESPQDIFSTNILGACMLLGLLALVPAVYQKYRQRFIKR